MLGTKGKSCRSIANGGYKIVQDGCQYNMLVFKLSWILNWTVRMFLLIVGPQIWSLLVILVSRTNGRQYGYCINTINCYHQYAKCTKKPSFFTRKCVLRLLWNYWFSCDPIYICYQLYDLLYRRERFCLHVDHRERQGVCWSSCEKLGSSKPACTTATVRSGPEGNHETSCKHTFIGVICFSTCMFHVCISLNVMLNVPKHVFLDIFIFMLLWFSKWS